MPTSASPASPTCDRRPPTTEPDANARRPAPGGGARQQPSAPDRRSRAESCSSRDRAARGCPGGDRWPRLEPEPRHGRRRLGSRAYGRHHRRPGRAGGRSVVDGPRRIPLGAERSRAVRPGAGDRGRGAAPTRPPRSTSCARSTSARAFRRNRPTSWPSASCGGDHAVCPRHHGPRGAGIRSQAARRLGLGRGRHVAGHCSRWAPWSRSCPSCS